MAHERLRPQFLFDEEKIKQLKQLAPECFEDGKINFETLRQNLGAWVQDEEDKDLEHFGLFWPGKRDARKIASMPPQGTLAPVYGEGLKADGKPDTDGINDSKNVFIEGENLEVLKILQKSYAGKIKMIYIDPPYNTGNDFVYDDDFTEPLQEYLRRTGQVDEEGKPLTTNKRSDGRFHSKWLSMMYPRLKLARNLLRDDGVIFISIDENEVHNLKSLCNEVFGEENFLGNAVRVSKKANNQGDYWSPNFDYILTYSCSKIDCPPFFGGINYEAYDQIENEDEERLGEKYQLIRLYMTSLDPLRGCTNQRYYIECPDGSLVIPPGDNYPDKMAEGEMIVPQTGDDKVWRWSWDTFKANRKRVVIKKARSSNLVSKKGESTKWNVYTKTYLKDVIENTTAKPNALVEEHINQNSSHELNELKIPFDFAKPSSLIHYLCEISRVGENDIVLDFFGGSGSTAHGVVEYSVKENRTVSFILVQYPEKIDEEKDAYKKGFKLISEISKERIRRVLSVNGIGFKSFELSMSNYKSWSNYTGTLVSELEKNLNLFNQEPLSEGWTNESLLSEIILMEGLALSSTIQKQSQYKKNEVVKVSDEYCEHSLLICLDKEIKQETIKSLELSGNDIFICLDSAISNVDKLKLSDKGLIKTI
jgi:adenine-specific DNA-methyltransferase